MSEDVTSLAGLLVYVLVGFVVWYGVLKICLMRRKP